MDDHSTWFQLRFSLYLSRIVQSILFIKTVLRELSWVDSWNSEQTSLVRWIQTKLPEVLTEFHIYRKQQDWGSCISVRINALYWCWRREDADTLHKLDGVTCALHSLETSVCTYVLGCHNSLLLTIPYIGISIRLLDLTNWIICLVSPHLYCLSL